MKEEIFDFDKHKGRKIKALVNYPLGGRVKKGEIGILKYGNIADFPSQSEYYCGVSDNFYKRFELLPEDDVKDVQFEVRKWYKFDWVGLNKKVILKIDKVTKTSVLTRNRIYVNTDDVNINAHDNGYFIKDMQNIELLTDLSEIQQYLPEGHVDKVKKELTVDDLIEDEIYNITYIEGRDYIILSAGKAEIKKYINVKLKDFNNTGNCSACKKIRLATPEEKKWLKVCIKQDKFIKQSELDKYDDEGNIKVIEQKPSKDLILGKFNIGDIVVSLTDCNYNRYIGSIFKVEEGSNKDSLYYLSGRKWSGAHSDWRLATPEETEFYNQGGKNINDMKLKPKEFVLPEKWCIKRNENNHKVINSWFSRTKNNKECFSFTSECGYLTSDYVNCSSWIHTTDTKPDGYTEITFEQFKKYVLKETETKVEEKPKQEPMKAAVHVKTSEEFDFVISKIREVGNRYNRWHNNKDKSCIDLSDGCYSDKNYFHRNNYKVISFEDWCKVNGYSKEEELKVGDCTKISIENPFEITNTQENINILPKPKELEVVPISKYFKIRN